MLRPVSSGIFAGRRKGFVVEGGQNENGRRVDNPRSACFLILECHPQIVPRMSLRLSESVAGAKESVPSHRPVRLLERELQSDLHHAVAPRANEWIASRKVGRQERSAECSVRAWGITGIDRARCARGIGGDGMVEGIENFPTRLNAIALFECEVLED